METNEKATQPIPKAALDRLEKNLANSLDAVRKAQGHRSDQVQHLCDLVGITKRDLAGGIILGCKGDITQVELADRLMVSRRSINNWSEIVSALQSMKDYDRVQTEFQSEHELN